MAVELAELSALNNAVAGRGVDRGPLEFVVPVEVLAELRCSTNRPRFGTYA